MINTIIVDDEPLAQEILETYLKEYDDFELIGSCKNALEANKLLKEHSIDVMFLDIQMPQLNGIEFLKILDSPPLVVFTTAFKEYALEGFELDALDYLLKPVRPARLHEALRKTLNRVDTGPLTQIPDQGRIAVQQGSQQLLLPIRSIRWAQAQGDYARIYTADDSHLVRLSLAGIEEEWAVYDFVRIHRSHVVNLNYATKIVQQDGRMRIYLDDTELPVSRRLMPQVRQRLKQLNFRTVPRSSG